MSNGEMDQRLRALLVLAEDSGSVSRTRIVAHNCSNFSSRRPNVLLCLLWAPDTQDTEIHAGKSLTCIIF